MSVRSDNQHNGKVVLTIDWEDWFHICDVEPFADPDKWDQFESRIERNTQRLLELLKRYDARATFFVIGELARRFPHVVKQVAEAGHEIAWHGETHHTWKTLDEPNMRREWIVGLTSFMQETGYRVHGFRAPMWSLTADLLRSHHDELVDLGLRYDSSLVPLAVVGNPAYPRTPTRIGSLMELPPTIVSFFGIAAPISMSWGFRWLPGWYVRWQLQRFARHNNYLMVAIHPWELDPDHGKLDLSRGVRFTHYAGLKNTYGRLEWLLQKKQAISCVDYVNTMEKSHDLLEFGL